MLDITLEVQDSHNGTTRYTLTCRTQKGGGWVYTATRDISQTTSSFYRRGDEEDVTVLATIPEKEIRPFLEEIRQLPMALCPEGEGGLDGTSYLVTLKSGFVQTSFQWWQTLPEGWEPLEKLFEFFGLRVRTEPLPTYISASDEFLALLEKAKKRKEES